MTAKRTADTLEAAGYQISASRTRYLGEPCSDGHNGWTYISTGQCCECIRLKRMQRYYRGRNESRLVRSLLYAPRMGGC